MRHRACVATFAVALAGSATACSDPTTPNGVDGLLRMTVVSAPALSDTIQAWAPEPLVVVLRGEDGRPLAGMPVRFEAGAVDTLRPFERPLFLCRRSVTTCNATSQGGIINVIDTTDASGQVQVRVRYGTIAGETFVRVVTWTPGTGVPAEGKPPVDSIAFRVWPGAAARVLIAPADTGIILGGTANVRAPVVDRFRNVRPEVGGITLIDGPLSPRPAGTFDGAAFGRARLVARYGALVDTGYVSVLPDGVFAALRSWTVDRLVVQRLDGRVLLESSIDNRQLLSSAAGYAPLSWSADGEQIVLGGDLLSCFPAEARHFPLLRVIVASGKVQPALNEALPFAGCESWGQLSRDGEWLYFGAAPWNEGWSLFRARADGTAIESIGPGRTDVRSWSEGSWRAEASADGSSIVYQRFGTRAGIEILDLESGSITALGVRGAAPRISPDGSRIAYVPIGGGALHLVSISGANPRPLTDGSLVFAEHAFGWSTDGSWLLAAAEGGVYLVDPVSGAVVLVPGTFGLTVPAWRP